ncbi:MAG: GTPase [Solirubrobacteraceae bacterium]
MSAGDLDRRLTALADAVELADGRLDEQQVQRARDAVARAGARLGLGVEATVVALAGPTGAGKSTLFNALAGEELTSAGVRRPTTATATAAVWGDGGDPLLDWLDVPRRHRRPGPGLDGLLLLDLPDFDSVVSAHRAEVDRVIALADLVVWVVDPQKYADGALHEHYLRPLAAYADTMLVVLNQADRLDGAALRACRSDLGRLLEADGLTGTPVLAVSAQDGTGVAELQAELARRVKAREAAVARLGADVTERAAALQGACVGTAGEVGRTERERLAAALGVSAGVPGVVSAVERAHRRRGALATGWPFVRWVRRVRPDPLRRLRLEDRGGGSAVPSLPPPGAISRAQTDLAVRALTDTAAADLPAPWPQRLRAAAAADETQLGEALGSAVARADLHVTRPRWWRVAGLVQLLAALIAAAGALWLLAVALLGFLHLQDALPVPDWHGIPVPTGLLGAALLLGLALTVITRLANRFGASRRARSARRALYAEVARVGDDLVIAPVRDELEARDRLCAALSAAAPRSGRLRR